MPVVPHEPESNRSPQEHPVLVSGLSDEEIRAELDMLCASHEFRTSKRSQDFLRFVTNAVLSGNADSLKERTIAIEVFGRLASYDPSEDATVRVKASEVRKRLGLYYANEGADHRIRIDLPAGTYVPEFRRVPIHEPANAATNATSVTMPDLVTPGAKRRVSRRTVALAGIVVLGVIVMASLAVQRLRPLSAMHRFWEPVLRGVSPVSICAEYVPVWALDRTRDSEGPPRLDEFTQLPDQFVGGGDLVAVARLTGMLGQLGRPYSIRVGKDVTFEQLRTAPAVLVGYSQTRWREISSQLRYFIDASRTPVMVTDNGAPTNWSLPNLPRDRHTTEDYAVLSRVFHPDTHTMLVGISGITQYGTEAASDLATRADLLGEALRNAPEGWERKNLQLVLHVKVISGAPAAPKVLAVHLW